MPEYLTQTVSRILISMVAQVKCLLYVRTEAEVGICKKENSMEKLNTLVTCIVHRIKLFSINDGIE